MEPMGFGAEVLRTRAQLLINRDMEAEAKRLGSWSLAKSGKMAKSQLIVPLTAGDDVLGMLDLSDSNSEDAFADADVRLLRRSPASMGVALENARLFDETQRLLKETEQRNAELAIINNVQEALASKLEIQAIYDLVGDKLREMFDSQGISLVELDTERNWRRYRYFWEKAGASTCPMGRSRRSASTSSARGRRCSSIATSLRRWLRSASRRRHCRDTEPAKSSVRVPIFAGDRVRGVISLDNVDREDAFSESEYACSRRWRAR